MKKFYKFIKYSVGFFLMLLIFSITTLAIILEPNIKIQSFETLDLNKLTAVSKTLLVLDDTENNITDCLYEDNKLFTKIESVPRQTIDAFISIEDKRFYSHNGIDYQRILSAIKNDIISRSFREGASTISQQLIKNTHLSSDKNISRKIQEMRIARALERQFSKEEILEMYLNILYFGNNIYGIGSASEIMFKKNVSELNLAESALLAGIINNPSRYNPLTNPEQSILRRNLVLTEMYKLNKINKTELEAAKAAKINTMSVIKHKNHYIDAALNQAASILYCDEADLYRKNISIGTSFDAHIQQVINEILAKARIPDGLGTQILVMSNASGEILSLSGLGATAGLASLRRQPGSTVKPVISYAPALEKRLAYPALPILDEKIDFSGYSPSNYRNKYAHWTTVEDALAQSSNVCAAKLLEMSGVEYAKTFAIKLGYDFGKNDTGLPLALGGMEKGLTLRQIANAYQAFANDGNYIKSSFVRYIKDSSGKLLYEQKMKETRAMSDETAYFINKMLGKCAKEGTGKLLNGCIKNICAKTGTVGDENGNTDAYCIAYTPEFTVAVWIGSKNSTEPHKITGGGLPASIARSILLSINPKNSQGFPRPNSIKTVELNRNEFNENHRLVLADKNTAPRYRKSAEFPENFPLQKQLTHTAPIVPASPIFVPDADFFYQATTETNRMDQHGQSASIGVIDPSNYIILQ